MFSLLTLETSFLKTKIFFKRSGYFFIVECTRMENAIFGYKTAPIKAMILI